MPEKSSKSSQVATYTPIYTPAELSKQHSHRDQATEQAKGPTQTYRVRAMQSNGCKGPTEAKA